MLKKKVPKTNLDPYTKDILSYHASAGNTASRLLACWHAEFQGHTLNKSDKWDGEFLRFQVDKMLIKCLTIIFLEFYRQYLSQIKAGNIWSTELIPSSAT